MSLKFSTCSQPEVGELCGDRGGEATEPVGEANVPGGEAAGPGGEATGPGGEATEPGGEKSITSCHMLLLIHA